MSSKRNSYSVKDKLEIIKKVKSGISVANINRDYKIPEATVRGWMAEEGKLKAFVDKLDEGVGLNRKKTRLKKNECGQDIKQSPRAEVQEELRNICCTCLSSDRTLVNVRELKHLEDELRTLRLNLKMDSMCWECKAVVAKMAKFRIQAGKAQQLLRRSYQLIRQDMSNTNSSYNLNESTLKLNSLSKLTIRTYSDICFTSHDGEICKTECEEMDIEIKTELCTLENTDVLVKELKLEPLENENSDNVEESNDGDLNDISNDVKQNNHDNLKEVKENNVGDDWIKVEIDNSKDKITKKKVKRSNINRFVSDDMLTETILTEEEMLKCRAGKIKKLEAKGDPYNCIKCILSFNTEISFKEHNESKHNDKSTDYICKVCENNFSSLKTMEEHYTNHFKAYKCTKCNFTHHLRSVTVRHCNAKHVPRGTYACSLCQKEFLNASARNYHRRTFHTKVVCEICGKELKEKYTLKAHMLLHTGMPLFECDVCHKSYRGQSGLLAHMRVHNTVQSENAYCAECNVQFGSLYKYRQHLKTNSRHIGKREQCVECNKTFTSLKSLQIHNDIQHLKNYNYTCDLCKKGFRVPNHLSRHIRNVHDKVPKVKRFECSICNKKFSAKTVLRTHMNLHTGARPHSCPTCDATFAQQGTLYRHRRLVHKLKKICQK